MMINRHLCLPSLLFCGFALSALAQSKSSPPTAQSAAAASNSTALPTAFKVTGVATSVGEGKAFTFEVQPVDSSGNEASDYTGTIVFQCPDGMSCPPPTKWKDKELYYAVAPVVGKVAISVHDQSTPTIQGQSDQIEIVSAPLTKYNGGEIVRLAVGGTDNFSPATSPAGKLFIDLNYENSLCLFWCEKKDTSVGKKDIAQKQGGGNGAAAPASDSLYDENAVDLGAHTRYWFDASVFGSGTSASSLSSASFASVASTAALASTVSSIVETARLRGGVAVRLGSPKHFQIGIPRSEQNMTATELIFGIGAQTPISAASTSPQVYCTNGVASNAATGMNGVASDAATGMNGCVAGSATASAPGTPTFTVLYPPNRDRFYTSWEAGFRFHTYYAPADNGKPILPASLELTVGENEAVTQGHLRGVVFHFDSFLPLPDDYDWIYVIVSGDFQRPGHNNGYAPAPFNLPLASSQPAPPYLAPVYTSMSGTLSQADSLRIGVAVDLVDLIKNHLKVPLK